MKTTMLLFSLLFSAIAASALPPAAADLKAKRDAKVAEIDRVYAAELDKLQKKAMEAGSLAAANEIQKELERVSVNPFADEKPSSAVLVGKWKRGSDDSVFEIKSSKLGVHLWNGGSSEFSITLNKAAKTVTFQTKRWTEVFMLTADADTLQCATKEKPEFSLTRMK